MDVGLLADACRRVAPDWEWFSRRSSSFDDGYNSGYLFRTPRDEGNDVVLLKCRQYRIVEDLRGSYRVKWGAIVEMSEGLAGRLVAGGVEQVVAELIECAGLVPVAIGGWYPRFVVSENVEGDLTIVPEVV